ncbi:MAG: class I tRNA ligase family protein, partial [Desulfobacula sp.]|nr:class I tRNA ligase family protein [Desulfobacula sp.]
KGSKMSKSIGNVTDPIQVTNKYGIDPFRYFLMREMVFGLDANFTEETIVSRINSDLANDLGNLFSRVLSMNSRYFTGEVKGSDAKIEKQKNLSLASDAKKAVDEFKQAMSLCEFHKGIEAIWKFISIMNKYIDTTAPWTLAKAAEFPTLAESETKLLMLETVLYNLIEGLRVVSCLIYPIMPQTSLKMQETLCMEKKEKGFYSLEETFPWGQIKKGTIIEKPDILFPRIDTNKIKPKSHKKKLSASNFDKSVAPGNPVK